jgi:hypothetical protein
MTDWSVKPGDIVESPARSGFESPERGRVLAVLEVPGRYWPDVVVTLPGGEVRMWRRWRPANREKW